MRVLGKAEPPSGRESCVSDLSSESLTCCVRALMQPLPGHSMVSHDVCAVLEGSNVVPRTRVSGKIKRIIPSERSPALEWRRDYPRCAD